MLQRDVERGEDEDEQADDVDAGEDQDGLIPAQVGVGDVRAEDGRDCDWSAAVHVGLDSGRTDARTIAPELEEVRQRRGPLLLEAQRAAAERAVVGPLHVVLEEARDAVVGEALAQLDDGHQPGRGGQVVGHVHQGRLLVLRRLPAVGRDVVTAALLLVGAALVFGRRLAVAGPGLGLERAAG